MCWALGRVLCFTFGVCVFIEILWHTPCIIATCHSTLGRVSHQQSCCLQRGPSGAYSSNRVRSVTTAITRKPRCSHSTGRYFNEESLREFINFRPKDNNGILQRFVRAWPLSTLYFCNIVLRCIP